LARGARIAPFYERGAQERLFEFHVSVEGILRLTAPNARRDPAMPLTSAALGLGQAELRLDVRVPTGEVRAIAKKVQDVGP
jgi:hypothetical protein